MPTRNEEERLNRTAIRDTKPNRSKSSSSTRVSVQPERMAFCRHRFADHSRHLAAVWHHRVSFGRDDFSLTLYDVNAALNVKALRTGDGTDHRPDPLKRILSRPGRPVCRRNGIGALRGLGG